MLAERGDDPLFDGAAAGATDGNTHFVVATQAEQIVLKCN